MEAGSTNPETRLIAISNMPKAEGRTALDGILGKFIRKQQRGDVLTWDA